MIRRWYLKSYGVPKRLGLLRNPLCWLRHDWYKAGEPHITFCARCGRQKVGRKHETPQGLPRPLR